MTKSALERAQDVRKQAAKLSDTVSKMSRGITNKRPPWVIKMEDSLREAGSVHFVPLRIMDEQINLLQAGDKDNVFMHLSPTAVRKALSDWRDDRRKGHVSDIDALIACAIEEDLSDESEGGSTLEKILRRQRRK